MLYSLEPQNWIERVWHQADFDRWRNRLTDEQHAAIQAELNRYVDTREIATSSWIPGADWEGTAFWPIYDGACRRSEEAAAKFFGLLVQEVFIARPETWSFGRYEKDGVEIGGMTYFQISRP